MPRVSEFQWRAKHRPRRSLWVLPLALLGAGVGTGYLFIQSGHEPQNVPSMPAVVEQGSELPLAIHHQVHNEMSAIASATTGAAEPELVENETSAIASAPLQVEVINPRPQEKAAPPDVPIRSLRTEHDGTSAAPNYAVLRRDLLRHLR